MKKIILLDGTEVEAQLLGSLATALNSKPINHES